MPSKEESKLLMELAKLDNKKQALQVGIAYFRLLMFPELHNAMKAAIAQELYTNFNSTF